MTIRKTLIVLSSIILGLILFKLVLAYGGSDLVFVLLGLTLVSILTAIIFFIIDRFKRTRYSRFYLPAALTLTTWLITNVIYFRKEIVGQSTTEYVVEKIEDYEEEFRHYPYAKNSDELVDTIGLNLNYISPEDFSYHFNRLENYYVIQTYNSDKSIHSVYDSRTKKETLVR